MLEIVQLFAAARGVGDVFEQDDQFVVVARRVVDQAAAGAFAVRAFPGLLPEGAGGDVLECGIYSHLAGRLSGMALRVDAQYPAGLLVDVRKQVVDRFARFVAQDVDAQVADRQVFDQLCEVAVIALRRLVTLIDGGQFGIFGSAFRNAADGSENRADARQRIVGGSHGSDLQASVAVGRDERFVERVGDLEGGAAGVNARPVLLAGQQVDLLERNAGAICAEKVRRQPRTGHFALSEVELPPSDAGGVE